MADLNALIEEKARAYGIDPATARAFVRIESGGRPNEVNKYGYSGLLQLSPGEYRRYGGAPGQILDPHQNLDVGMKKLRTETDRFKAQYGREPTANDLYMTHQQGEGGYAAHAANPTAPAWQNMYSTAEGRAKGPGWAKKAIWGNIPTDQRAQFGDVNNVTSQDFMDLWKAKVERYGGAPVNATDAMTANLRRKYGTTTEGGAVAAPASKPAAAPLDATGISRLKAALSGYDPDALKSAEDLVESGRKIAGSSGNAIGAIGGTLMAGLGNWQGSGQREARKADEAKLMESVANGGGAAGTIKALMASSDPEYRRLGLQMLMESQKSKPQEWVPTQDGTGVINKATGEYRATGAQKQETPTDIEKRAVAAGLKPGTPDYNNYVLNGPERTANQTELEKRAIAGGLKPGTPDYEAYILGGPPKTSTEKWNEGQSKAANFGRMMVTAEENIAKLGPKDADGKPKVDDKGNPLPTASQKGWFQAVFDGVVPFVNYPNWMTSTDYQNYKQAASQWIGAKLRKESGASISPAEEENEFKRFFPQIGDSAETLKQKAAARAEAQRGMIAESAGAYDHFFGAKAKKGAGAAPNGGYDAGNGVKFGGAPVDIVTGRPLKTSTPNATTGAPVAGSSAGAAPLSDAVGPAAMTPETAAPPVLAPKPGAVTKLLQNPTPEMQAFFDRKYGAGAAARAMAAQPAPSAPSWATPSDYGQEIY